MPPGHILISRQEDIPPEVVGDFTTTLSELSIPFEAEETERRIFNALEYYIPTALVIFIAKPFFNAFLKKAGEDSYALFKRGLAALVTRASRINVRMISSNPQKISKTSPFSRVISIYSYSASGARIKFLLPAEASEDECLQIIDSILMLLRENHTGASSDQLSRMMLVTKTRSLKVLRYDFDSASWQLLEPTYGSNPPKA
jgi:hypothetical protein